MRSSLKIGQSLKSPITLNTFKTANTMKTLRITVTEPNYPTVSILIHGRLVANYIGIPEKIGVHQAINLRANRECDDVLMPFYREHPTYITPVRLRCHIPYFRNCTRIY
ncbi:hypothetical protein GCM10028807_50150 [Spirosoma daeguense]